jgi:hypothetical protein
VVLRNAAELILMALGALTAEGRNGGTEFAGEDFDKWRGDRNLQVRGRGPGSKEFFQGDSGVDSRE